MFVTYYITTTYYKSDPKNKKKLNIWILSCYNNTFDFIELFRLP